MTDSHAFGAASALCAGLAAVFLQTAPVGAQAYPHTEEAARVDNVFASWDRPDSPGAAVGIIKDGRLVYARGYGMANLEYDIPNTPETVFRIGSTSKHFTAVAAAILIEQGKLSLDDDIRKFLPELPAYEAPVTVGHMIHHTSGLRNYEHLTVLAGIDSPLHPSPYYTDEEAVAMIARQKALDFTPGEKYAYSNSNYFLLAEIIGRVSGMKTADFAEQYMFKPLGMTNTHFHDDVDRIVRNRASGYSPAEEGSFRINMTRLEQIGTGSIFTTVEDFLKWDRNFYDNRLGEGRRSLIEMVETPGRRNDGESVDYGFGLNVERYGGLRMISHGGAFAGFRSYYMRFPDQRFSIVLLANQGPFPLEDTVYAVAEIYLEDLFTEPRPAREEEEGAPETPRRIRLSERERAAFEGDFHSAELDALYRIRADGKALTLTVGRFYTGELVPVAKDEFVWDLGVLAFQRNADGAVAGFALHSDPIRNIGFVKTNAKQ